MRASRLWSALPLLVSMCLLSWSLLPAHAQPSQNQDSGANRPGHRKGNKQRRQEEAGPPCASPNYLAPSGLVVVIINKAQDSSFLDTGDTGALNNPCISGVALQIHWADIELVEGKPDWSKLDQLFAAAESSKKWVQLLIFPGFFTPAWALEGVKTEPFAIQYGPGKGTVESLPMPWNKLYLKRWLAFMKQLSERYGKSPAFRVVTDAGPTSVSAEKSLPQRPKDIKTWQSEAYTPRKYMKAWQ